MYLIIWLNIRQTILEWDRDLFVKLNGDWTNPLFDAVLPWLRNSALWMPLYLFILFFVVLNFKNKSGWWILLFITTVALTDMTGTYVIKHNFERFRPCNDPDMYLYVRRYWITVLADTVLSPIMLPIILAWQRFFISASGK